MITTTELQQQNGSPSCSPLDDFLANAETYNAAAVAKFIDAVVRRSAYLTGGEIAVTVSGIDKSKSLKTVLKWCAENPQPADKLSKAIDVMVSGWEQAKFMDLLDEANDQAQFREERA